MWILGLGAFGLAFSITTTAAYLPPLLEKFTDSNTMIAAVLAAEGVFALTLPLVIGPWSDTFKTPMGRRRPFMFAALWPMGFCLAIVAFMPNIWTMTLIVLAFFFAYYVYEPPYRGLYPDVLHESLYGRSQGVQHVLRGTALGIALVAGGFLFKVWHPAPFLARGARDHRRLRRRGGARAGARGRRLACVPRRPQLRADELGRLPRGARGAAVPVRQRGVGGDVRGDADVRRPLHHNWARRAALDVFGGARHRRGRLRDRCSWLLASRQPLRPGAGDPGGVVRLRRRAARSGPRDRVAQLVLRIHPPGRGRGRHGDDALVGSALQADARAAPRRHLGPRDDHQGYGPARRPSRRRGVDRRDEALPVDDGRLRGCCGRCALCRCWRRSRSSRR